MNKNQKRQIKSVLKMNKCKYCKDTENLTIDHKIPQALGGKDIISNLQCLCKRCNTFKSKMSDKQVRNYFKWFLKIQESRQSKGSNPYKLK